MPYFDYIFTDAINSEMKQFVELLDIWLPPHWYDPSVSVASVRAASPDYSFVARQSTLSYEGIVYRPIPAVRTSVKETQTGEDTTMNISLDGIGYITPEPLIVTGFTDAELTSYFTQYPDGTVLKTTEEHFYKRDGSSLVSYDTPKSLNLLLREMEILGASVRLRRVPVPLRGSTYTSTPKVIFRGYISSYSGNASSITFNCVGMLHKWGSGMVPARLMGPGCQVPFGSSSCGVVNNQGVDDLSDVTTTDNNYAVVMSQDVSFSDVDYYQLSDAAALSSITEDNHFGAGAVIVVSADYPYDKYAGRYARIKYFDSTTSTLYLCSPLPLPAALMDDPSTYNLVLAYRATCGHNKTECKRWKNLENYKGMDVPKVPTLSSGMELY